MIKTIFLDSTSSLYNDTDLAWLQSLLLGRGYIANPDGSPTFQLSQSVIAGNSLLVKAGYLISEITKGGKTWNLIIKNDADTSVAIPQNVSGITMYAHIIIKIDNTVVPNAPASNISSIQVVTLDTATPTDMQITDEIGDFDFYNLGYATLVDSNPAILDAVITNISTKVSMNFAVDITALEAYVQTLEITNGALQSGTGISFVASTSKILDSGNGFVTSEFLVGTEIEVSGSASNDGIYTVVSVSAGEIEVAEALTDESAGATMTITSVATSKIVQTKADGKIAEELLPSSLFPLEIQLGAAEAIATNDAVALIDTYQPLGAITLENHASIASGGSFTVGNFSNRCLIVMIAVGGNTGSVDVASATYGGVAMTNIGNGFISNNGYGHSGKVVMFKLVAPTVGSNVLTFSITGTLQHAHVYSYYNVEQVTSVNQILGHNSGFGPWSYTPSVINCLPISSLATSGLSITSNDVQFGGTNTTHKLGGTASWSGDGAVRSTASAFNIEHTYSSSGGSSDSWVVHIAGVLLPANPAQVGAVKTNATISARTTTYAGFAKAGVAQDEEVTVVIHGKKGGFTGLTPLATYYVSNTAGLIGTSAGSTSKKIGFAISSTEILMKDYIA